MNALLEDGCMGKVVAGPSCSIRDEHQVEELVRIIPSFSFKITMETTHDSKRDISLGFTCGENIWSAKFFGK